MMIDDPEDEAWAEMEKKQNELGGRRKAQIAQLMSVKGAFAAWEHSHSPHKYFVELRAFKAGWVAALRNQREREQND